MAALVFDRTMIVAGLLLLFSAFFVLAASDIKAVNTTEWPNATLITPTPGALALSDGAIATQELLERSESDLEDLKDSTFSYKKTSDMLLGARQIFEAQVALERSGGKADYSLVRARADDIRAEKNRAFEVSDQLSALKQVLDSKDGASLNLSGPLFLYGQALDLFSKERYDDAAALIDEAYEKISQAESENTIAFSIYRATRDTVADFLARYWQVFIASAVVIAVAGYLLRNTVSYYLTLAEITRLEQERSTVEGLVKRTQFEYFEKKSVSEEAYSVRIKKFGEMIRDIDRQIPLLREKTFSKPGKFVPVITVPGSKPTKAAAPPIVVPTGPARKAAATQSAHPRPRPRKRKTYRRK